jgi:16S rRNA (adenine1518-N6/adenine1519-N6)-dimethyltransferase
MNLLEHTKNLCKLYHIIPARSKGQNFLIREEVYDEMVTAANLKTDETVLEVGPGLGFLTAKLAAQAGKVMAVELDDKLAGVLKTGLLAKGVKNVEVVNEDILKFSIFNSQFSISKFKIVANLPYNITSIFIRKYLEAENKPELMVLMLQKEVAERITAKPGKMSLLAVSVQFYAKAEIVRSVPKEFFWPKPEVDSAIVKITPNRPPFNLPLINGENVSEAEVEKEFFRLVKFGFSAKRKMLKNNLAAGFKIDQTEAAEKIKAAGFNEKIRAQELSVEDWLKLLAQRF